MMDASIMRLSCLLVPIILSSMLGSVEAAIVTYTDPAAFNIAISGRSIFSEDFDGSAVGTTIANGGSIGQFTFTYNWGNGESLRVNNDNSTNSGANYLGSTDGALTSDFVARENDITFTPAGDSSAFGLFVITPNPAIDPAFSGDIVLSAGGANAELASSSLATLADNSQVYFLGLVEDTGAAIGPYSLTASIGAGAVQLPYRIDGLQAATAVPEPSVVSAMSILLLLVSRYRSRQSCLEC